MVRNDYAHYLGFTPDVVSLESWAANCQRILTNEDLAADLMGTDTYYKASTGVPDTVVPVSRNSDPSWAADNANIESQAAQGTAPVRLLGRLHHLSVATYRPGCVEPELCSPERLRCGHWWRHDAKPAVRVENGDLNGASPKVVVIMIGVNNVVVDTPQDVAAGVAAVVGTVQQRLPETKILLLSILPAVLNVPNGNLMPQIAAVNSLLADLGNGTNIFYVDLWPAFTNSDGSFRPELHVSERAALNADGYAVVAQSIAPELDDLLSQG